jgi:hypothetical protein
MTDEMIIHQDAPGFLAPVVAVKDALIAYQAKKDLIDGIMKENVDYGVIPGSKKPSLLKAGAEKATSFFGLCPRFTDAEAVEDWTGEKHNGEPFFYYRRTCNLYRGSTLVASVDGSCNSWEKKYRYRWVEESQVPAHINKATLKTQGGRVSEFVFAIEKAETSGKYGKPAEYWQRFRDAIENGTAVQISRKTSKGTSPAWEIDGTMYCLPNEDPADIVNTVLKMADKRALVAATLIATGLSEYFTQDVEDYIDATFSDIPAPKAAAPAKMTYEQAAAYTFSSGGRTCIMGEIADVAKLNKIISAATKEETRQAATICLMHDFGMEPGELDTLPGMETPKSSGLPD